MAGRLAWPPVILRTSQRVVGFTGTALRWGLVVGLAEGFWFLAPIILRTHHIAAGTTTQWIEVIVLLALLFLCFGALLSGPIAGVTLAIVAAARRAPRDPQWLLGFAITVGVIPAYIATGALIYFARFGHLGNTSGYFLALASAIPILIVSSTGLVMVHRLRVFGSSRARTRFVERAFAGFAIIGAAALPIRVHTSSVPAREAHALVPAAAVGGARRPLLILAIDGGNWRTIQPLVDAGRLKTIGGMLQTGIRGEIEAAWPPFWSTSAWGAIATGFSREEVNVFGDLVATLPGLPPFQPPLDLEPRLIPVSAVEYALTHLGIMRVAPPPRSALKAPPFWELLDRSGVKTAVVRFNFTYPADGQASVVISNRVVPDMWDALGVDVADAGLVAPADRARELLASFSDGWTPSRDELLRVLPESDSRTPKDALMDPIAVLTKVLPYDQRTFQAAEQVLRSDPDVAVEVVHVGGFDNVCHAFWQYRFPGDFDQPPAPDDVKVLGPVIDRYVEFIDRGLAALVASFSTEPNVLIVSDHGEGAVQYAAPWRGVHASPGIFLAAGPDVSHRSNVEHVSYYDVVPTVLDLQHLEKASSMRGRSILQSPDDGF